MCSLPAPVRVSRWHTSCRSSTGCCASKAANPNAAPSIKAIVVYPMNALANSQRGELEKFLTRGYGRGHEPVTYARYTGQEKDVERASHHGQSTGHPADQLRDARTAAHPPAGTPATHSRGSGASVSGARRTAHLPRSPRRRCGMLVRPLRDACNATDLQCVGTSATMSVGGHSGRAARHCGRAWPADCSAPSVTPEAVIGETLVRATGGGAIDDPAAACRSHGAAEAASE